MADILAEMLDLHVLKHKGMMILSIANIVGMLGFYVPIIFAADRAKGLGVDDTNAALLISIMGKQLLKHISFWVKFNKLDVLSSKMYIMVMRNSQTWYLNIHILAHEANKACTYDTI